MLKVNNTEYQQLLCHYQTIGSNKQTNKQKKQNKNKIRKKENFVNVSFIDYNFSLKKKTKKRKKKWRKKEEKKRKRKRERKEKSQSAKKRENKEKKKKKKERCQKSLIAARYITKQWWYLQHQIWQETKIYQNDHGFSVLNEVFQFTINGPYRSIDRLLFGNNIKKKIITVYVSYGGNERKLYVIYYQALSNT